MDLSDGLIGDLPKILAMSDVAARLDRVAIPVAAAVRALFPGGADELALTGGEDYELLATVSADRVDGVMDAAREVGSTLTVVGRIVERSNRSTPLTLVEADGSERPAAGGAFDHFA
jgi:thiamine-monophosphate kinase